ncbi:unnamed protein product [Protopolystoma xenopodis]|uniref:Uncharacterized protein n=1 Tax=Protopolystoma xenopodis TaxID=117903 RepID=A0A448XE39_9PLAT|nr:unnamed protein product [Protopolystoma xenopodis]
MHFNYLYRKVSTHLRGSKKVATSSSSVIKAISLLGKATKQTSLTGGLIAASPARSRRGLTSRGRVRRSRIASGISRFPPTSPETPVSSLSSIVIQDTGGLPLTLSPVISPISGRVEPKTHPSSPVRSSVRGGHHDSIRKAAHNVSDQLDIEMNSPSKVKKTGLHSSIQVVQPIPGKWLSPTRSILPHEPPVPQDLTPASSIPSTKRRTRPTIGSPNRTTFGIQRRVTMSTRSRVISPPSASSSYSPSKQTSPLLSPPRSDKTKAASTDHTDSPSLIQLRSSVKRAHSASSPSKNISPFKRRKKLITSLVPALSTSNSASASSQTTRELSPLLTKQKKHSPFSQTHTPQSRKSLPISSPRSLVNGDAAIDRDRHFKRSIQANRETPSVQSPAISSITSKTISLASPAPDPAFSRLRRRSQLASSEAVTEPNISSHSSSSRRRTNYARPSTVGETRPNALTSPTDRISRASRHAAVTTSVPISVAPNTSAVLRSGHIKSISPSQSSNSSGRPTTRADRKSNSGTRPLMNLR